MIKCSSDDSDSKWRMYSHQLSKNNLWTIRQRWIFIVGLHWIKPSVEDLEIKCTSEITAAHVLEILSYAE